MTTQVLRDRRVSVDTVLSTLTIGISPDQEYISDQLLPVLSTPQDEITLGTQGNEAFTMVDDLVGDHSTFKRIDVARNKVKFAIDGHALGAPLSDREAKVAANGAFNYDLGADLAQVVKYDMLLRREYLGASLIQNTAVYPGANVLTQAAKLWNDNTKDPYDTLIPLIQGTLKTSIGRAPNVFWMAQDSWLAFIQNTKVKDRIFGTTSSRPAVITPEVVAANLGIPKVLVGRAVSRDAADAITYLWTNSAGLIYVPPTAGKRVPAFGYTAEQTVFGGASEYVTKIRDEEMGASGGWVIKRGAFYSQVITYNGAGILFTHTVS